MIVWVWVWVFPVFSICWLTAPLLPLLDWLTDCIQMVGYTPDYWLIRNSWAEDWGENGYIYVSTKEAKGNLCGVLDEVNFANAVGTKHRKH